MITALAIFAFLVGLGLIAEHLRFRARCQRAKGRLVELEEIKSWSSSGTSAGSGRQVILFRPVWEVGGEGTRQRITSTEASSSMKLEIGLEQAILIDPKHPGTGRLASSGPWVWAGGCFAAGAFLLFAAQTGLFN
ncbi:MAG: hypothetical protein AAGJ28_17170 [Pseudomonadota bacterium]